MENLLEMEELLWYSFLKGQIKRYEQQFDKLQHDLNENFDYYASWNLAEMIKAHFILKLYKKVEVCGEFDLIYRECERFVLYSYNSEERSTSQSSNFVDSQRYTARLIFMDEVKPYLTENK